MFAAQQASGQWDRDNANVAGGQAGGLQNGLFQLGAAGTSACSGVEGEQGRHHEQLLFTLAGARPVLRSSASVSRHT